MVFAQVGRLVFGGGWVEETMGALSAETVAELASFAELAALLAAVSKSPKSELAALGTGIGISALRDV